jgi:hypothetical protein
VTAKTGTVVLDGRLQWQAQEGEGSGLQGSAGPRSARSVGWFVVNGLLREEVAAQAREVATQEESVQVAARRR